MAPSTATLKGSASEVSLNTYNVAGRPALLDVFSFDSVFANLSSSLGLDIATLVDSAGNDNFSASGSTADMNYANGMHIQVSNFDTVYANGYNGGTNHKNIAASAKFVILNGSWI